jgi:hypothetical protein
VSWVNSPSLKSTVQRTWNSLCFTRILLQQKKKQKQNGVFGIEFLMHWLSIALQSLYKSLSNLLLILRFSL